MFEIIRFEDVYQKEVLHLDKQAKEKFVDLLLGGNGQEDLMNIDEYYFLTGGDFFVLLENEQVVGTCGYKPKSNMIVELKRLRIENSCQGKGYGSNLLKEIEDKIKNKDYKKIVLETAELRPKTIEFYNVGRQNISSCNCNPKSNLS